MDADDVSHPDRLQEQVRYLAEHLRCDVLGTGAILLDRGGREIGFDTLPAEHAMLAARMYKQSPFYHPSVMYRRRWIERMGGYDVRLRRAEDQDLWLRGYRSSVYANLQVPLIKYRVRARPTWRTALYGAYVLAANGRRERRLDAVGYATRYLAAAAYSRARHRDEP
jgi:hypothetical protein